MCSSNGCFSLWNIIFYWSFSTVLLLVFSGFNMVHIGLVYFEFIFWKFTERLESINSCFYQIWEVFSHYFFEYFFLCQSLTLPLLGLQWTNVVPSDMIPQISKVLFLFVCLFFPSLSCILNNFYWSSSSLILSSVFTILLLSPFHSLNFFFYFCYCIYHFSFFVASIFLVNIFTFAFVLRVIAFTSWNMFITAVLNAPCDHFSIGIISELASVSYLFSYKFSRFSLLLFEYFWVVSWIFWILFNKTLDSTKILGTAMIFLFC